MKPTISGFFSSRSLAVFLFAAAATAGNLSLKRYGLDPLFSQVRFPLTVACVIAAVFATFGRGPARSALDAAALITALFAALAIHCALFGASDIRQRYIIDLTHGALLVWLAALLIRDEADVETFCLSLIVAGFALIPPWWLGRPPFGPITFYRVEFIAFSAALLLYFRGWRHMVWLLPMFLFCSLHSGSKAALVGAPVAATYGCFLLATRERPWLKIAAASFIALAAFAATISSPALNRIAQSAPTAAVDEPNPTTLSSSPGQLLSNSITLPDNSQRLQMALIALKIWSEHPFEGAGIGAFDVVAMSTDPTKPVMPERYRYPHNVSLEVLYSTGLAGFAAFALVAIILVARLHRQINRDHSIIAIATGAIFVVLTAHFSGDLYDVRMFWILLVPAWAACTDRLNPKTSAKFR